MTSNTFTQGRTIAAISTAFGKGGIATIRISGDEAISVADKMFFPKSRSLSEISSNCAVYGNIIKDNTKIDDGIAVVFRAPHSYTGEDTVEISCHGGILLAQTVLECALCCGAYPAAAGEFTRRAFTAGKISLTEAEAVGMLIDATTNEQIKLAAAQTSGILKDKCLKIAQELKTLISSTYAYVDFPDEDLEDVSSSEMLTSLLSAKTELEKLRDSYRTGHAVSEGIIAAIVGRPNVGKSTFLNLLAQKDLAIVTDVPGTTRDVISENVSLGKVLLRLSDTAGIRTSDDTVEKIGIDRAKDALSKAELVFAVFDGSAELNGEDREICDLLSKTNAAKIAIINKQDLCQKLKKEEISEFFSKTLEISAKENEGARTLIVSAVEELFLCGSIDYNTTAVVANARQFAGISKCLRLVQNAIDSLSEGYTQDIAGMDLESALGAILEVDGRDISQAIVDDIFSRFCVGK